MQNHYRFHLLTTFAAANVTTAVLADRCFAADPPLAPKQTLTVNPGRALLSFLAFLSILWIIASFSTQLSPAYDPSIYIPLTTLNVKAETLFASLSGGGTASNFPTYKETYDQLIGGFSAARMATATREVPPLSQRLFGSSQVKAACGDDPSDCVNPTPHHLDQVTALLTTMRDTHQQGKLAGELVNGFNGHGGFKNKYESEMSRVLVFEAALQR